MKKDAFVAVDYGTNRFKILIADKNGEPLEKSMSLLCLNTGNNLNEDKLGENLGILFDKLNEYQLNPRNPRVKIVATEGVRSAQNKEKVISTIKNFGFNLEEATGEREAELSVKGALSQIKTMPDKNILLIDMGGGSTEVSLIDKDSHEILVTESIKVGSRVLVENEKVAAKSGFKGMARIEANKEICSKALKFISNAGDAFNGGDLYVVMNSEASLRVANGYYDGAYRDLNEKDVGNHIPTEDLKDRFTQILSMKPEQVIENNLLGENLKKNFKEAKKDLSLADNRKVFGRGIGKTLQFIEAAFISDQLFEHFKLKNSEVVNITFAGVKEGVMEELIVDDEERRKKHEQKMLKEQKTI